MSELRCTREPFGCFWDKNLSQKHWLFKFQTIFCLRCKFQCDMEEIITGTSNGRNHYWNFQQFLLSELLVDGQVLCFLEPASLVLPKLLSKQLLEGVHHTFGFSKPIFANSFIVKFSICFFWTKTLRQNTKQFKTNWFASRRVDCWFQKYGNWS